MVDGAHNNNKISIRVGTRESPLALAQARLVADHLAQALSFPKDNITFVPMTTSGDRLKERPLSDQGGKGLFVKELEAALLCGDIDLAVHSLKDMETIISSHLVIAACLPREDPRDVLITRCGRSLDDFLAGARMGTVSPRRHAQLKRKYPGLDIVPLRGNVGTRIKKLQDGLFEGIVLAAAGLKRLGLKDSSGDLSVGHVVGTAIGVEGSFHIAPFSVEEMLPAAGQGIIGIQCRADHPLRVLLEATSHVETHLCMNVEREVLRLLGGSCHTPIAIYAVYQGKQVYVQAMWVDTQAAMTETVTPAYATAKGMDPFKVAQEIVRQLQKKITHS